MRGSDYVTEKGEFEVDKEFESELMLGNKLSEAPRNNGKIAFNVAWRTALCLLCSFAAIGGMNGIARWKVEGPRLWDIIFCVGMIVFFGLFPLIHLRDKLEFYENGIVFGKKTYTLKELGDISWRNSSNVIDSTYMRTNVKSFNVTYLVHPKKAYNQAYLKH